MKTQIAQDADAIRARDAELQRIRTDAENQRQARLVAERRAEQAESRSPMFSNSQQLSPVQTPITSPPQAGSDTPTTATRQPTLKPPNLTKFKIEKFSAKETYAGLGTDFDPWLHRFHDEIEMDIASNQTHWTESHKYMALKKSLDDSPARFVLAQENSWKAAVPSGETFSFNHLVERLRDAYTTHLDVDQLMAKMRMEKRYAHTWNEHVEYLRHIQRQIGAPDSLVLSMFTKYACPELKTTLVASVIKISQNDTRELDKAVNTLVTLTGTAVNYGKKGKGPVHGQANLATTTNSSNGSQNDRRNNAKNHQSRGKTNIRISEAAVEALDATVLNELALPAGMRGISHRRALSEEPTDWNRRYRKYQQTQATPNTSTATRLTPPTQTSGLTQPRGAFGLLASGENDWEANWIHRSPSAPANLAMGDAHHSQSNNAHVEMWILDSGCSHHLVANPAYLENPRPSSLRIRVANNECVNAELVGTVLLDLNDTGEQIILGEVHYIPGLSANLLSVSSMVRKGFTITFDEAEAVIKYGTHIISRTREHDKLWGGERGKHFHWHIALGHLNKAAVIKLARDSTPENMVITRSEHDLKLPCLECAVGKQSRSKQPVVDTSASAPTDEIGAVIASDVAGKTTPSDRYGNKYYVNNVDYGSGFVTTYAIKRKSEQAAKAMEFLAEFETSFTVKVKVFRSDRGGEYLSEKFRTFLAKRGIRHELTEKDTSASNGKAERMHRTLLNATRTMIFGSDLPSKFWSHALSYATYLRNRVPSKSNADMLSPLAILTGKQPCLSHALPFGSICTVRIEPRSKGIERRAEIGRILGVNSQTKAYDVWVARLGKVVVSRDVQNISRPRNRLVSEADLPPVMEIISDLSGETLTHSIDKQLNQQREMCAKLDKLRSNHERSAPEPRRSDRIHAIQLAKGGHVALVMTFVDPKTPNEALSGPNADKWRDAMQLEVDSLIGNGTWELVDRPPNTNIVSNKWVFKVKYDSERDVEKFKARLVARGFSQRYGVDYTETFSPVIKQQSVRLLLALGLRFNVDVIHMDVLQAYVKAGLDTEIYMEIPALVPGDPETQALRLLKSLYGLKQSGRMWHADIDATLLEIGLKKSLLDPCLYHSWSEHGITLLGLYVDDIMALSQDEAFLQEIKNELESKYQVISFGCVKRILGINVHRKDGSMFLEQTSLIEELLEKQGMSDCHAQSTPLSLDHKMTEPGEPAKMTQSTMREIVGSLQWLAGCARPDISFATSLLSRFLNAPNEHHENIIKRILRYLSGTKHFGLEIKPTPSKEMNVSTDADWAGDKSNRKSTTGFIVEVCGAIVHWFSKQQPTVALSTMEAEYIAACVGTQEALWIQQIMAEIGLERKDEPVSLWCDNQSAIRNMSNDILASRAKHMDIKYRFVRDAVQKGRIVVGYFGTDEMPADGLTKALSVERFEEARKMLHVVSRNESLAMDALTMEFHIEEGC
ncbi:hypothetical protein Ae201684_014072 [Aphanomyces euteiches]|uniref:Integrase catalytic domain-containing protein n=1 Tax=Aphanomyces euteiches TaxID=100861 RepID=A0A6G0WL08_9STRA|nr:hypothetical protein Ae201684_014072 [Aphanomyces euteiches]